MTKHASATSAVPRTTAGQRTTATRARSKDGGTGRKSAAKRAKKSATRATGSRAERSSRADNFSCRAGRPSGNPTASGHSSEAQLVSNSAFDPGLCVGSRRRLRPTVCPIALSRGRGLDAHSSRPRPTMLSVVSEGSRYGCTEGGTNGWRARDLAGERWILSALERSNSSADACHSVVQSAGQTYEDRALPGARRGGTGGDRNSHT